MLQQDEIVVIPEARVKFFGTRGKMLLPSPATIARVIQQIPAQKVITTNQLRQYLADEFEVEAVCPVTTKKSLATVAQENDNGTPYWRVINQNGNVISNLPDGVAKLRQDGFTIAMDGKKARVIDYQSCLAELN